ncbi:MAG: DUF4091 domain-containing protein [Bacteroidales bacterium]|nr:DUF4091 domain-containing protein [Bacteroidales bacterium]
MRKHILLLCLSIWALSCTRNPAFELTVYDPMDKMCCSEFADTSSLARGETLSIQVKLRSGQAITVEGISLEDRLFDDIEVWRVGNVRSTYHYSPPASDRLYGDCFPDILYYTDFPEPLEQEATYFIEARVSRDARPGVYRPKLKFRTSAGTQTMPVPVKIYPVTLEKQSLKLVNWIFDDLRDSSIVRYSDEYFREMAEIVRLASRYGQNVWKIPEGTDRTEAPYDFSIFNRYVELFLDNAEDVELIAGNHIGGRSQSRWTDPIVSRIPDVEGYVAALYDNLCSHKMEDGRSWADIYVQHVADEPIECNIADWESLARRVKATAPLKIIEAYRTPFYNPGLIDIIVPQLDEVSWPSYTSNPQGGQSEKWFYTCMYPLWDYPNRFVELPLGKTRILHWMNFRFGFTGYLHWGLNYWAGAENPLEDLSNPASMWPGGDAMLFYRLGGRTLPSLRAAAMRDGVNDHTLLTMLARRDSTAADRICREIIENEYTCDCTPASIRKQRKEILELLAGEE